MSRRTELFSHNDVQIAILELPHTTVPVRPRQSVSIDRFGNLVLNVR